MSRITGSDALKMFEAYAAVYPSVEQIELTEEQVWEEVENWVNSLLEEGYDLSEYTWEEMYEDYLSELSGNLIGDLQSAWRNRGAVKSGAERVGTGASKSLSDAGAGINKAAASTLKPIARAATSNTAKAAAAGFTSGGLIGAIQGAMGSRGNKPPSPAAQDKVGPKIVGPKIVGPKIVGPKIVGPKPPAAQQPTAPAPSTRLAAAAPTGGKGKVAPTKPSASAQTGDKAKDMATWAKANPKLAAAAAERARTRGTSATTNPQMDGLKSRLPAPAAPKVAPSNTLSNTVAAASKPAAFSPAPEVKATNTIAAAPKPTPVSPRQARLNMEMEYDAYDLVLEYLLSQGHAETVEEAHYVMMEMDAETIGTIVEKYSTFGYDADDPGNDFEKFVEKGPKTNKQKRNAIEHKNKILSRSGMPVKGV